MSSPRRNRRSPLPLAIAIAAVCSLPLSRVVAADVAGLAPFRVAFTSPMFTDVNENDARAAVKAWATTIAKERNIDVATDPQILPDAPSLDRVLSEKSVDAAGMTVLEYWQTGAAQRWAPILGAAIGGRVADVYYLLVHGDSDIQGIADLRGRTVLVHHNPRVSLAEFWLEDLLRSEQPSDPSGFFGRVSPVPKLSSVILPVFFRQADACVVTRWGFETLTELNPQIGRDLRVLVVSPELIATVFCLRADYDSPQRESLLTGLEELHLSASGRQVLTIFHSDRLERISPDALSNSLRLIEASRSPRQAAPTDPGATTLRPIPREERRPS